MVPTDYIDMGLYFILFFLVGQWLDWKVIHKMILINQNQLIVSKWKSTALSCIICEHTVA